MTEQTPSSDPTSLCTIFAEAAVFSLMLSSAVNAARKTEGIAIIPGDAGAAWIMQALGNFKGQRSIDAETAKHYAASIHQLEDIVGSFVHLLGRDKVRALFADSVKTVACIPAGVSIDPNTRRAIYADALKAPVLAGLLP